MPTPESKRREECQSRKARVSAFTTWREVRDARRTRRGGCEGRVGGPQLFRGRQPDKFSQEYRFSLALPTTPVRCVRAHARKLSATSPTDTGRSTVLLYTTVHVSYNSTPISRTVKKKNTLRFGNFQAKFFFILQIKNICYFGAKNPQKKHTQNKKKIREGDVVVGEGRVS